MSDYTPTTDEVRKFISKTVWPVAEFDRWLAEVKAQAWVEGFDAGERDVFEHDRTGWDDSPCIPNPYRQGEM